MTAAEQRAERGQRATAREYRRRTGRDRPTPDYPAAGLVAWRAAHRDARMDGAWTHTPPGSALALLDVLAADGPLDSGTLVARAGVSQGNATSRTLPRLETAGLVTSRPVPMPRYRNRFTTEWALTERGRGVLTALTAPEGR